MKERRQGDTCFVSCYRSFSIAWNVSFCWYLNPSFFSWFINILPFHWEAMVFYERSSWVCVKSPMKKNLRKNKQKKSPPTQETIVIYICSCFFFFKRIMVNPGRLWRTGIPISEKVSFKEKMNSSLLQYCVILQQMNSADTSGLKYTFCKCVKSLILTVYYANLGSATLSSVRRVWGKNEVKHCFFLFYVKFILLFIF